MQLYYNININKNQDTNKKGKVFLVQLVYQVIRKKCSIKQMEVNKMLDNRFLIKTDGLDRKKAERAREGILFVLKMSDADPDLLWYVVEWYYGVKVHPDTDIKTMQSLVRRLEKHLAKKTSE